MSSEKCAPSNLNMRNKMSKFGLKFISKLNSAGSLKAGQDMKMHNYRNFILMLKHFLIKFIWEKRTQGDVGVTSRL